MQALVLIAIVIIVALFSPQAGALQQVLTEAEFDATMKEVGLTLGDAEGHIDARYWPETAVDGQRLRSMFQEVEAFWKAREGEEAAIMAADAMAASRAMTTAAKENNRESARTLSASFVALALDVTWITGSKPTTAIRSSHSSEIARKLLKSRLKSQVSLLVESRQNNRSGYGALTPAVVLSCRTVRIIPSRVDPRCHTDGATYHTTTDAI